jgi:hypothetical protein
MATEPPTPYASDNLVINASSVIDTASGCAIVLHSLCASSVLLRLQIPASSHTQKTLDLQRGTNQLLVSGVLLKILTICMWKTLQDVVVVLPNLSYQNLDKIIEFTTTPG